MPTSIHCPYCHKHTALSVAKTSYQGDYGSTNYIAAIYSDDSRNDWWMGICNGCRGVVLVQNNGSFIAPTPLPSPTEKEIPKEIREDLIEAKLCFSVDCYRAACTMARRAMQQACIAKGASGKDLVAQIKDLTAKGIITKDLEEWATVVRWIGNDGAHPGKQEITKDDTKDCLDLAEQFLHVVFVTPALAKARRTARGK